jgi:hypothetical protein
VNFEPAKGNMKNRIFQPLTTETAPDASRPVLEKIQKAYGFIPNLIATYANSPAVLKGYLALDAEFEKAAFSRGEQQVILLVLLC